MRPRLGLASLLLLTLALPAHAQDTRVTLSTNPAKWLFIGLPNVELEVAGPTGWSARLLGEVLLNSALAHPAGVLEVGAQYHLSGDPTREGAFLGPSVGLIWPQPGTQGSLQPMVGLTGGYRWPFWQQWHATPRLLVHQPLGGSAPVAGAELLLGYGF